MPELLTVTVTPIVGSAQVGEWIGADLQSSVSLLLPLCFAAFFVVTAIALAFHRRRHVKRTYVAGFLAVFVTVISSVSPSSR